MKMTRRKILSCFFSSSVIIPINVFAQTNRPAKPVKILIVTDECLFEAEKLSSSVGTSIFQYDSSGHNALDKTLLSEVNSLNIAFGTNANFFYYNDFTGENAFAQPVDGRPNVSFGFRLIYSSLKIPAPFLSPRQSSGNTLAQYGAIAAIMAHEWGHTLQFKFKKEFGVDEVNKHGMGAELHADFLSGWYMGQKVPTALVDASAILDTFHQLGDYDFNNPDHHGTPRQRSDVVREGFRQAKMGIHNPFEAYKVGRNIVQEMI